VTWKGHDNRYHNLDGYWVGGDGPGDGDWQDFQRRLQDSHGQDDSRVLSVSPWKGSDDRPLARLEQQDVATAFRANDRLPDLRQTDAPAEHLVGAERLLGESCVPEHLPPLEPKPEAVARGAVRVVCPGKNDSSNGLYPSLPAAALDARPGDVILLRANDELPVDSVSLNKKEVADLTIRPDRGYHPVLTLGVTSDRDAALFHVHDGKLRLEDLEFRLRPGSDEFKAQSLIALVGDGQCTLRRCVVTLDRAGRETSLAVAALPEAGKVMRTDMPPGRSRDQGPRLVLEDCLVRGEGDLVCVRCQQAGRPVELEVKNTLAALGGSLLNVEVGADAAAPAAAQKVVVRLAQVTTYLGHHLIQLQAGKDLKGLVPVVCKPTDCLFVPAPAGRSLLHVEGAEVEEKALREKLQWDGDRNAYGAFTSLLDQQPPGDEMPLLMSLDKWKAFTGEGAGSKFGVKPAAVPPADTPFTQVLPSQFKPAEDLPGAGAAQLPRPSGNDK
jgi:hypothetical protein